MIDPEHGATEFERELLNAARAERVPAALKQRMARAMQQAPHAAGASAASLTSKLSLLGVISIAALSVAIVARTWRSDPARPRPVAQLARVSQPALAPLAAEPASAVAPSAAAASSAPATQAAPPIAREQHARAGGSPDALRAEIALLDNARVALREGSGERALDALARHARRFPHGTLSPEADALRVEALIQTGATDRARALSRRFFANYPNSPLAERVARAVSSQPAR